MSHCRSPLAANPVQLVSQLLAYVQPQLGQTRLAPPAALLPPPNLHRCAPSCLCSQVGEKRMAEEGGFRELRLKRLFI